MHGLCCVCFRPLYTAGGGRPARGAWCARARPQSGGGGGGGCVLARMLLKTFLAPGALLPFTQCTSLFLSSARRLAEGGLPTEGVRAPLRPLAHSEAFTPGICAHRRAARGGATRLKRPSWPRHQRRAWCFKTGTTAMRRRAPCRDGGWAVTGRCRPPPPPRCRPPPGCGTRRQTLACRRCAPQIKDLNRGSFGFVVLARDRQTGEQVGCARPAVLAVAADTLQSLGLARPCTAVGGTRGWPALAPVHANDLPLCAEIMRRWRSSSLRGGPRCVRGRLRACCRAAARLRARGKSCAC